MADKEIKFKLTADASGLNKGLDDAQKKSKEIEGSAQKASSSLSQAAQGIAAAFAGAKVVGFFNSAVDAANKLQASLARVESAARAFGQSTIKAKEAAQDLAQDGFLNLNQAAGSLSNLMQSGLSLDQAKKFVTASKDITAFNNTIGDASQAVEDLTAGIIKNSAEVIENASPALKSINQQYQGLVTTQGKAKAVQFLYTEVLKMGNKFAGDAALYLDTAAAAQKRYDAATEKAAATIGQKLQPAYKSLFDMATGVVNVFTKLVDSLGATTVSIATLSVMVAITGAALVKLGASIGLSFTAALGPIGLILAGVGLLTAAIIELRRRSSGDYLAEEYRKSGKELQLLTERSKELEAQTKKSAAQEAELLKIRQQLADKAKELGLDYDKLAKTYKNAGDMAQYLADAERNINREKAAKRLTEELNDLGDEIKARGEGKGGVKRVVKALYSAGISEALRDDDATLKAKYEKKVQDIAELYQPKVEEAKKPTGDAGVQRQLNDVRFIETQKKLVQIEQDRRDTVALARGNKQKIADANQDAAQRARAETDALRQTYAAYIEDRNLAETLALRQQTDAAIRSVKEAENANSITKAEAEEKIQKIREANIRKEKELRLKSFADTASAANETLGGIGQIAKSKDVAGALGGTGSTLGGLSKFAPQLGALAPLGQAFGAVGGIVGTLTSLFGKSDEERQKEAEEQKRRDEEVKAILALQANYQKNMLELQQAAAKLPFENLTRQLRLIDIQAQQKRVAGGNEAQIETERLQARQGAIQGVLTGQAGAISGGQLFGGTDATPEGLTKFLNERAAQAPAVAQFLQLMDTLAQTTQTGLSWGVAQEIARQLQTYKGKIPDAIYNTAQPFLDGIDEAQALVDSRDSSLITGKAYDPFAFANALAGAAFRAQGGASTARALGSEVTQDTTTAENLISVIEQGQQTNLEIAANTKKTAQNTSLQLDKDRAAAFVDIAGGGLRQFGSFLSGKPLTLNAQAGALSLASVVAKTSTKSDNELLSELVKVSSDMRLLLTEIAINTNRSAGDVGGSFAESDLLTMLENFKARS